MNKHRLLTVTRLLLSLTIVSAWLSGGCASKSSDSLAPKPGNGIAQYREVVNEGYRAVTTTVKSLEALARPGTPVSLQHSALPGFDRAFQQLEHTSVRTRARAEAIITRGQTYFDEWKESFSSTTNRATAKAELDRYTRLHERFEQVRQRSSEVREVFRPFMNQLREFRAHLDRTINTGGYESAQQDLNNLIAGGRRVLRTLDSVSIELSDAEAALRLTRASKQ